MRGALALLDEVGLDGLTLRRLADDLGVKAPALYWHFASKADLLAEMATTMLRDLIEGAAWDEATAAGEPWQECVRESAANVRAMLLGRRDGARVFSGATVSGDRLREAIAEPLEILTAAGFSTEDATRAWGTLLSYVLGFAIEEQSAGSARAAAAGEDSTDRFTFGVDVVVAGLEERLRLASETW